MLMAITSSEAMWFSPIVLPVCLYVIFTDMSRMRITNQAVAILILAFVILGVFALPFENYLWRLLAFVIALSAGMLFNAIGAMGAGDSKFIAAAAPYIAFDDYRLLMIIFTIVLTSALITHRGVRMTPLRNLAPDWVSWSTGKKFPMGMALGFTLALYLGLGILYGA